MDICLGRFLLLSQLKPNLAQPMTHETSPCLLLRLPSPNQTHIKIKREDRLFFFTQHTLHVSKKNPSPNSSLQNSRHYFFHPLHSTLIIQEGTKAIVSDSRIVQKFWFGDYTKFWRCDQLKVFLVLFHLLAATSR